MGTHNLPNLCIYRDRLSEALQNVLTSSLI